MRDVISAVLLLGGVSFSLIAGVGLVRPGQHLNERGFARAVLAKDAVHLACTHVEIDSA